MKAYGIIGIKLTIQCLENSCYQPSKGISVSYQRIRELKERDRLHLSYAMPKIQWPSNLSLSLWLLGYGKPLLFIYYLD